MLVLPTLVAHASDEVRARYLPGILNGEEGWCQLFSEPGSGSDLASLRTRAVRDGDEWVISGQKIWTSGGQYADYGMLLARTDPTAPKHQGITFFAFSMRQPGVEVRPLREMTGDAIFNEVFIDDARVPHANIIGELNGGWSVANTTLAVERAGIGGATVSAGTSATPGSRAGHLDVPAVDILASRSSAQREHVDFDYLVRLARFQGRGKDPLVRQRLAAIYSLARIAEWHLGRARAGATGSAFDGNMAKVRGSQQLVAIRDLGLELLGFGGMLAGPDAPGGGAVQRFALASPGPSIYGGTDQIQRNIIAERGLGLPREAGPPSSTPFNELAHNVERPANGARA
jgi:alkylation response protein AidB-like acyl-CoA dehydrogenase